MDGYFSSVLLAEQLLNKGFYVIGTTRHNRRHFPKELLVEGKEKERDEWVSGRRGTALSSSPRGGTRSPSTSFAPALIRRNPRR